MVRLIKLLCEINCADSVSIVLATQAISNVIKSSFGPSGLDKMMVDDIGVRDIGEPRRAVWQPLTSSLVQDVTVTNDGATILSLLDIEHPAGKILVDLAQQQDKEVWAFHIPDDVISEY